jgi:hypothetical protein
LQHCNASYYAHAVARALQNQDCVSSMLMLLLLLVVTVYNGTSGGGSTSRMGSRRGSNETDASDVSAAIEAHMNSISNSNITAASQQQPQQHQQQPQSQQQQQQQHQYSKLQHELEVTSPQRPVPLDHHGRLQAVQHRFSSGSSGNSKVQVEEVVQPPASLRAQSNAMLSNRMSARLWPSLNRGRSASVCVDDTTGNSNTNSSSAGGVNDTATASNINSSSTAVHSQSALLQSPVHQTSRGCNGSVNGSGSPIRSYSQSPDKTRHLQQSRLRLSGDNTTTGNSSSSSNGNAFSATTGSIGMPVLYNGSENRESISSSTVAAITGSRNLRGVSSADLLTHSGLELKRSGGANTATASTTATAAGAIGSGANITTTSQGRRHSTGSIAAAYEIAVSLGTNDAQIGPVIASSTANKPGGSKKDNDHAEAETKQVCKHCYTTIQQ